MNGQDVNGNCLNGVCLNNVCSSPKQLGQVCKPGECGNGLQCSQGFCQKTGIKTGNEGAFCIPSGSPGCTIPLRCNDDNNTCVSGTQGFKDSCNNTDTFCISGLQCTRKECLFPTPPENCTVTQKCTTGYNCSSNKCLGGTGSMCSIDSQCSGNNCQKQNLSILTWEGGLTTTNDNVTVSTLPGWKPFTNLPPQVMFDRIVATTNGTSDTLWGLNTSDTVGGGGLYLLTNPSNGTWSKTSTANNQEVRFDCSERQSISGKFLTIATDRKDIYILIETDINEQQPTWDIKRVELNADHSINLVSVAGLDSPKADNIGEENNLIIKDITDFDINTDGDVVLIGNIPFSNPDFSLGINQIYVKRTDSMNFSLAKDSRSPDQFQTDIKFQLVRYYFLGSRIVNGQAIDNSMNIGYVERQPASDGDSGQDSESLMFLGAVESVIYPQDYLTNNYTIPDVAMGDFTSISSSDVWMNAIRLDNTNTSYLEIRGGSQYMIPGYNGPNSRLFVTLNNIYTQADGLCV